MPKITEFLFAAAFVYAMVWVMWSTPVGDPVFEN